MRFKVPQFIDVEDKIIGPLTFKQFIYLGGGAGICAVLFKFLNMYIAIILGLPILVFAVALAFYRPNSKPFIELVQAFFEYMISSRLYVWKREEKTPVARKSGEEMPQAQIYVPKLSESKLKELSYALDVHEEENKENEDNI
ncbi:MAG: PrgI family protein [Minisyncoccia bacterium]